MREAQRQSRELTLGLLVVAVLGLAAWVSTVAIDGVPWASPYTIRIALPAGAPVLTAGDDVRVNGERVGQVQSVGLAPGSGSRAVATLELSSRVGPGASARIRPRGLAGAVYVDVSPGATGRSLGSGSLIPATGGVQLTDVIAGFDAAARRALAQTADAYGTGLAGQGDTLGDVLGTAPSLLSQTTSVLRAAAPGLAGAIGSARVVSGALAPLGGVLRSGAEVLRVTGAHANAIEETIQAVPAAEQAGAAVLPSAGKLLARLGATARELGPGVGALAQALPSLERIEREGPQIDGFGRVAAAAVPVLRALEPALGALPGPVAGLTPLSTPLWTLAGVLIPYRTELLQAPLGFTRWGNFTYDFGTGAGHRAVRFTMVLTCGLARDPYPAPGAAAKERKRCP